MGSIPNPIGQPPKDPYEGYKTEEIDPNKREKESLPPGGKKIFLFAWAILLKLYKFLETLNRGAGRGLSTSEREEVRNNLLLLKAACEILKAEDRSQDIDFLNRFSTLWNEALSHLLLFKKGEPYATLFKELQKSIDAYPEGQAHTLGYYLVEFAGQKWLPFPYMELIEKIHRLGENGPLDHWIKLLEQLIQSQD